MPLLWFPLVCFGYWGKVSSEKQTPQVIANKQKGKTSIEGLELSRELTKQVLSQLSHTLTVEDTIILKHFCPYRNPFLLSGQVKSGQRMWPGT
jgi:hypothetical protein